MRENLAITDPANPAQTLPVGQQSSRGVELRLRHEAAAGTCRSRATCAWVDATLDDFYESVGGVPVSRAGNRPTNTPCARGQPLGGLPFAPQWTAGVDVRALSSRYADTANTAKAAGVRRSSALICAGSWIRRTSLTVRGRNLGDRDFVAYAISTDMVYLGEPQSWELELRRDF